MDDSLPTLRPEEAVSEPEAPVAPVVSPVPAVPLRLHADLLRSMALVGVGILLGCGAAMLAVYFSGKM